MFICPKCGGDNVGCLSYRDPMAYVEEQLFSEGETTDNCLKGDLEPSSFAASANARIAVHAS